MTRSENMEHVEVLRHMKETIKAIAPSEVAALDAAIASLSAPQPPAEAQPVAHYCEHRQKCKWHGDGPWPSFGTGEGRPQAWKDAHTERCGGRILSLYAAPPSAPVGVDALRDARTIYDIACIRAEYANATREDVEFKAIALRNYNFLAQQPAAVDSVRGLVAKWREEATAYVVRANEKDKSGGFRWAGWMRDELRSKAGVCKRHADELESALAGQQGGSDNDR